MWAKKLDSYDVSNKSASALKYQNGLFFKCHSKKYIINKNNNEFMYCKRKK